MAVTRRRLMEGGALSAALLAMAGACARRDQAQATGLAELDAVETASRIKSGELSALDAVEGAIERAARIDARLNAIVTRTFGRAREAAAQAQGPLGGVPTFVKDLDNIAGVATRFGSRAFPFYKGKEQSPLINAYLGLGVVSLGKSSTPEFGLSATTESIATGATRNPWNTDYSTGGSSGGAAALVAAGVVPIAHASDGGGSIRIPASCCGNVGLKTTRGRFPPARPDSPDLPIALSVHGVQTRTVRDTAAVAAALERPPEESGLAPIGMVSAPAPRRLRIALVDKGLKDRPINADVAAATQAVAARCAELGHEVTPVALPFDPVLEDDFMLYWAAFANSVVTSWEEVFPWPPNGFAFEPFTLGLIRFFRANADKFEPAVARLQAAPDTFSAVFDDYDVVLSPVTAAPPPPIGYLGGRVDYETLKERLLDYVQFTAFYNISGAPAISLPLSMSPDGLPIGAMFGADHGDEKTLLELAFELEDAMPWRERRPAIFG